MNEGSRGTASKPDGLFCLVGVLAVVLESVVAVSGSGAASVSPLPSRMLSFEERVAAQRAIEDVYWRHRIWPEQNPGPKPALAQVLPETAIDTKVEDYLEKSNALETWWRRPVTAEQLQAELERMSRQTHDPELLRELYAALGNDPPF